VYSPLSKDKVEYELKVKASLFYLVGLLDRGSLLGYFYLEKVHTG